MTVREAIYKIIGQSEFGIPSDDVRLRPRKVYAALKSARARVIKDSQTPTDFNYQDLTCVELERVTAHECGCLDVEGCYYWKSKCQLPSVIKGEIIVTTIEPNQHYSMTDWTRIRDHVHDKYTSISKRFFIRNNHIFLINNTLKTEYMTIRAMFEDPVAAKANCQACLDPCASYLDYDFPMDEAYFLRVRQIVEMELFGNKKEDRLNDTTNTY